MTIHTGDALLDKFQTPLQRIASLGWETDANPPFPSEGRRAWADKVRGKVWVWPENISSKPRGSDMWLQAARHLVWHELGHVWWFTHGLHVAWWQRIRGFTRPSTMSDEEYRRRVREDHAECYAIGAFTGDSWQGIGWLWFNKTRPTTAQKQAARRTEPV